MYTGFLHTHKLVVILFLLIYVIKTALLLFDKTELLEKFTKKIKVPEIVISTLFLLTGVYMLFNTANITIFMYVKIFLVFASIPLAVVGFKKKNKLLAALSLTLIVLSYGLAEINKKQALKQMTPSAPSATKTEAAQTAISGKTIYTQYCISCHGEAGDLGLSGAKNLKISTLSLNEKIDLITNGKNAMAAYSSILDSTQIKAVAEYTETLQRK